MEQPVLYLGNKRYSSWSLRAWLVLRKADIGFDEKLIPLNDVDTRAAISAISPGGTVPALHTGYGVIWDSLAICEWAAEQIPDLWPAHQAQRGRARSVVSMMHAGFYALREHCPMDLGRDSAPLDLSDETLRDVEALQAVWHDVRGGGPYLFGDWSIADAFFTPVASRFRSYGIPLHADAQDYCDTLLSDSLFREWEAAAALENFPNPYENLV